MNDLQAIEIIEGITEIEFEDGIIEAYQHLVDTGTIWHLQGSYTRTAVQLLESGQVLKNYK